MAIGFKLLWSKTKFYVPPQQQLTLKVVTSEGKNNLTLFYFGAGPRLGRRKFLFEARGCVQSMDDYCGKQFLL